MAISIAIETPLQDDVRALVDRLNAHLLPLSPLEFQFKMTVEQMAGADTTLFVARDESGKAVGMGALKVHSAELGEVKRMFTDPEVRGRRIGSALLDAIVALARDKGLPVLMLETGTGDGMAEAHRLYTRSGFTPRGPFLDYPDSEWSAFYEMPLKVEASA
ncbi:MAG: GNAT family N-acetyltransferase [Alphaproteobacteria bacterium]|nr:GNAT family N-acetyltransferase [Alphaproteobacteria bacterium]MBU1560826.1 GNAT family N-acetyltransferase [Alphaproteobacteria bacterium]MBU2304800.1 GNAT family N-acetyltransferase [Alphaproteobacteria bacterium]MBU2370096.1 GNAT family N-acetyltransferase [Alphaproteobacteria bacterium]